jgi:acyl carrier protein
LLCSSSKPEERNSDSKKGGEQYPPLFIKKGGILMQCAIWLLMEPDNGHYDSKYAMEIINALAQRYGVKIQRTYQTMDSGFGQEEKFLIEGEPENIEMFTNAVKDELC